MELLTLPLPPDWLRPPPEPKLWSAEEPTLPSKAHWSTKPSTSSSNRPPPACAVLLANLRRHVYVSQA